MVGLGCEAIEVASTKGCSQRSSDPRYRGVGASPAQSLNEGLLSEEQRRYPSCDA